MPSFQTPSIAQFTYVIHFKELEEKIRFAQGDAEVAFGSFGAGQSQQTNVPDGSDPTVPRILFVKGNRNISISSHAVQLQHVFPANVNAVSLKVQLTEIAAEVQAFHAQALDFQRNGREYGHVALIAVVNYPSAADTSELHKYFFERFLKVEPLGDLASVSFATGFRSGDFFLNVNGAVYELRQFDMKLDKPGFINPLNLAFNRDSKVLSKGVQFTVDVNDRPRSMSPSRTDGLIPPERLLDVVFDVVTNKLPRMADAGTQS
ncbi:hypothetical protein AB4Y40_30170 [Paraburkholderia sp. EG287B]|uniref:hypothetical protein n=1 Tax=Paraburkholderia sp. EG287B TaxID=3237010 RepID=UPI0034D1F810